MIIKNIY